MEEFAILSWKLIEHKILYYQPENFLKSFLKFKSIPDDEYDALEVQYLKLCKSLNKPNTIVHKEYEALTDIQNLSTIELDWGRPSTRLAFDKLKKEERRFRKRGKTAL